MRHRNYETAHLAAHVAEKAAAAAVADVLELNFEPVRRVNQDLCGHALPHPHPPDHAVLGQPRHDLVRAKPLDAESYVRSEGGRPASLDERDELRSGPDPEDGQQ